MNKHMVRLAIIIVMSCLLCSCAYSSNMIQPGKVHAGMSYADFKGVIDGKDCFQYCGYAFYETSGRTFEVVRFNGEYSAIEEVRSFKTSKTNSSAKSFESIQEGMTIWEVVEKVGLPYGTATSGMITLAFRANDGSTYVIYWDTSSDSDWTVQSILNHLS